MSGKKAPKPIDPTGGAPGYWTYSGLLTGWNYSATKGRDTEGQKGWQLTADTESHGEIEVWLTTWADTYRLMIASESTHGEQLLYAAGRGIEVLTTREMLFAAYNWTPHEEQWQWTATSKTWNKGADDIWQGWENGEVTETYTEPELREFMREQLDALGVTDPFRVRRAMS